MKSIRLRIRRLVTMCVVAVVALVPTAVSAGEPTTVLRAQLEDPPYLAEELSTYCGETIYGQWSMDIRIIAHGNGTANICGFQTITYTDEDGNAFIDRIVWNDRPESYDPDTFTSDGIETEQLLNLNWHFHGDNGVFTVRFQIIWDNGTFVGIVPLVEHPYPFDEKTEHVVIDGFYAPWSIVCDTLSQ